MRRREEMKSKKRRWSRGEDRNRMRAERDQHLTTQLAANHQIQSVILLREMYAQGLNQVTHH